MAFALGDIIVDRIQYGWAEKFDGTPLYVLTQLSDANIEITAESKDSVDKDGTLIKRFWQGKSGTFTATNAMINLNMLEAASGIDAAVVSDGVIRTRGQENLSAAELSEGKIIMPKIVTGAAGASMTLAGYIANTIHVCVLNSNGSMGDTIAVAATADSTHYSITSGGALVLPSAGEGLPTRYIIKYDRYVENGAVVKNSADKFPATVKFTLKVLAVDPCSADTLKAAYVVMESFQPSPEVSVGLTTDTTLDFSGDLQVNYCSSDKELYSIYWADDDSEQ